MTLLIIAIQYHDNVWFKLQYKRGKVKRKEQENGKKGDRLVRYFILYLALLDC